MENNKRELSKLSTDMCWVKKELTAIKDNHLASIYDKIDAMEHTLNSRPTWLISGIFSSLAALIVYLLTK